jgi:hypothetical protein
MITHSRKQKSVHFIYLTMILVINSFSCSTLDVVTPPTAVLEIFPYAGDTTTIFTFDASKSTDAEDVKEKLTVRWDWNNDGTWDTNFQSQLKTAHSFTQTGINHIRMELSDEGGLTQELTDSIRIFPIPITGSFTDPRDGQVYKTVLLDGTWWMAESLRYGSFIISDSLQKDNGIPEVYAYGNEIQNLIEYGGLYSWYEAMQYNDSEKGQGICPPSWHIPSFNEWKTIAPFTLPYLFLNYYYGPGGPGGLNLKYGGMYTFVWEQPGGPKYENYFSGQNASAGFWTSTHREDKFEDFSKHVAFQRLNQSINIENVLNGSIPGSFGNMGLFVRGDNIHVSGEVIAYLRFSGHPKMARYAKYVRCIKNQ